MTIFRKKLPPVIAKIKAELDDNAYRLSAWTASEKRKAQLRDELERVRALTKAFETVDQMKQDTNRMIAEAFDEEMCLYEELWKASEELRPYL